MRKEKAILLVSFGTSYPETRKKTIDRITAETASLYPDYEVVTAFTSPTILRILRKRGEEMFDPEEALSYLAKSGVKEVYLQPTHLIPGIEYDRLAETAQSFSGSFAVLRIGRPLLDSGADVKKVLTILTSEIALEEDEALVLMGHGSPHEANAVYLDMNDYFAADGRQRVFVGTVEAKLDLGDMLRLLKQNRYTRAALAPMLLVAGEHANHDMAGDDPDSWKSQFAQNGITPRCIIKGIGEYRAIRKMYYQKLGALIGER